MKRGKFNFSGAAVTEYALVIGIVSFAFLSMNVYINRGLQGKVRDMTNYFISSQQIGEINPTSISNSVTKSSSPLVKLDINLFSGGSSSMVYSDTTTTTLTGDSTDQDLPVRDGVFVPVEAGTVTPSEGDGSGGRVPMGPYIPPNGPPPGVTDYSRE